MTRCPRAFDSVSVTMIYNKALEESACGLQHQHYEFYCSRWSTFVSPGLLERKKKLDVQQHKFRVPTVSTDERYIMPYLVIVAERARSVMSWPAVRDQHSSEIFDFTVQNLLQSQREKKCPF